MRIVIVIEGEGIADESSKAIDQECKKCGKNLGIQLVIIVAKIVH